MIHRNRADIHELGEVVLVWNLKELEVCCFHAGGG